MKLPLIVLVSLLFSTSIGLGQGKGKKKKRDAVPAPKWMQNITRKPPGPYSALDPVSLSYNLSWKNTINAGKLTIDVLPSPDGESSYIGSAEGKSTGLARALWPYDFKAISQVDQTTLRPLLFSLNEAERSARNSYRIEFKDDRMISNTVQLSESKGSEGPISHTSRFRHDFVQDVLSSVFYMRSQALIQGEDISMIVTPFNRPYFAEAVVLGREKKKIKGTTYNTIKLDIQIKKIHSDLRLESYKTIKKATLWISDDTYRLPLELQADIAVGFISARLTDRKWIKK